jgi:small GTP-binding protein
MEGVPISKVILLGDGNVGKTSLARRYCEGKFEVSRIMTIGVDFQTKLVELPGQTVKLSIWDVAGQPRFQAVRESFYRGSTSAALVYDLGERNSLDNLPSWVEEVRKFAPNVKFVVIGNKLDTVPQPPDLAKAGMEFAMSIGAPFLLTSASTGSGVENMFDYIARLAFGFQIQQ